MAEDDRSKRRVGDATRERIEDLADGWDLPAKAQPAATKAVADGSDGALDPTVPARAARPSRPPPMPPPGSPARTVAPNLAVDTVPTPREDETTLMREPPAGATERPRAPQPHPRRGLVGDVRYVISVALGVTRARRELQTIEATIDAERDRREQALVAIGAAAIADDAIHHAALGAARNQLIAIEEERAGHAGTAAAADAELAAQRRDRERETTRLAAEIASGEAELMRIGEALAPLERDAQAARRRQTEVKDTLASIERRMAAAESSLVAVKRRTDPAAVAAEIAHLRADRVEVAKEAPAIAAHLDALNPRIAALAADRAAVEKKLRDARAADAESARRTDDVCAAIAARKKVEDRAVKEGEASRGKALYALGERLYLDRAAGLGDQTDAIEERDLAIATAERRALELRDVVASVDRAAFARGAAVLGAAMIVLVALVWWIAAR